MSNLYSDVVIFDCDGVLIDSNTLKTQAFRDTLKDYPQEIVDNFIHYHRSNGGISRYVKLRKFFIDFLDIPVDEYRLSFLLESFSNSCKLLYQKANLTPGCLFVLETLHKSIPLYVASGSAEDELREVFVQRNLQKFFVNIYGSPKTKQDCVEQIIQEVGHEKKILFIGDAESDWKAAKKTGISFIFMSKFSDAADFMQQQAKKENFIVIESLKDLLPFLKN